MSNSSIMQAEWECKNWCGFGGGWSRLVGLWTNPLHSSLPVRALNPVFHKRSKHIEIKYHWIREHVGPSGRGTASALARDSKQACQYSL